MNESLLQEAKNVIKHKYIKRRSLSSFAFIDVRCDVLTQSVIIPHHKKNAIAVDAKVLIIVKSCYCIARAIALKVSQLLLRIMRS